MEKVKRSIHNVPQDLLNVDTWSFAKVGELCITDNGCLDEVKELIRVQAREPFNAFTRVKYKHSKVTGRDYYLVTVKKGKTFKRWGKTFKG